MYLSLFFISLLSATLIPISSEGALIGALLLNYDPLTLLLVASLGNCSGVTINYFLGKFGVSFFVVKICKFDQAKMDRYQEKFQKYNIFFLLSSWLPIIGDPITVYLGLIKYPFGKYALIVYTTRILRYIAIIYLYYLY